MRIAFAFALATTLSSVAASAARDTEMSLTGREFLEACSKPDPEWISFCHGYVQAVYDGVTYPGEDLCVPLGTSRAEIVGTVVRSLTEIPSTQGANAANVVYSVLRTAYPCP